MEIIKPIFKKIFKRNKPEGLPKNKDGFYQDYVRPETNWTEWIRDSKGNLIAVPKDRIEIH